MEESEENIALMNLIDEVYTAYPFYGRRRIAMALREKGHCVNPKRIRRLMAVMGLEAIYPKPNLSLRHPGHKIYPYLLRDVEIVRPGQVWSTDITYIRMVGGFAYLVAVIDWFSRYVLSWRLSNTLDSYFCLSALDEALMQGDPDIFNTDQGAQFTSVDFTGRLLDAGIAVSMDGKGRALDNVFVERLWRSVKYEEIYLRDYQTMEALSQGLSRYFTFYNHERLHQSLGYQTPHAIHFGAGTLSENAS